MTTTYESIAQAQENLDQAKRYRPKTDEAKRLQRMNIAQIQAWIDHARTQEVLT